MIGLVSDRRATSLKPTRLKVEASPVKTNMGATFSFLGSTG